MKKLFAAFFFLFALSALFPQAALEKTGEPEIARPLRASGEALPERFLLERRARDFSERLPEIPGLEHSLSDYWVKYYSTRGRLEWIAETLARGEVYLGFIRQKIEEREMPPELLYLPVIESGFLVSARSRSGASGLWQFMRNSMKPYMEADQWRDERLDFWKSTEAALSKLQAHYREFGSWPLALAAYNSGGGAVSRVIKTANSKDYWYLAETKSLKTESIHYVPKLLALSYIISNPRKFNLDICRPVSEHAWTRVELPGQVNIASLAEASGLKTSELRDANRELITLITPPAGYALKVREESAGAVRAALEKGDLPLVKQFLHTIRTGDTLFALSKQYGVPVDSILTQNPGLRPQALSPGAKISIPLLRDAPPPPSPPARAKAKPEAPRLPPAAPPGEWSASHTVKKGETLWALGRKYGVSAEELARANGLALNAVLSVGKTLRVPSPR